MINKMLKKTFIQTITVLFVILLMSSLTFAGTHQKSSLFNYKVEIEVNGQGNLYWDYGNNMTLFLDKDAVTYNEDCKIINHETYKFSKVFDRGIVPQPDEGHYFAGFYDEEGNEINLSKIKIDILRVNLDGIYHYDYYASYDNNKFKNYTEAAYKRTVKDYVKTVYGTSRYKVMTSTYLYEIPKEDAFYAAKFEPKKTPVVSVKNAITKTYGNKKFYLMSKKSFLYDYTFKSSNKNVLTVDQDTGCITIKGPGIAKVTCIINETEKTLSKKLVSTITVNPAKVNHLQASQTKKKLTVKWTKESKNSGYEIQISNNRSFKSILASKTVKSGRYNTTTLNLKSEICNNYIRIRAYKTSNGKKIYGKYTVANINHN